MQTTNTMSDKKELLKRLFTAHNVDLLDTLADLDPNVLPQVLDKILCPICLVGFSEDAIDTEDLTDGHIWPDSIRARSNTQQPHRVLLCANCNHTSGSRGDKQMQFLEEIKDEEDRGYYRERRVQLVFGLDVKPIELNAILAVTEKRDKEIKTNFRFNPNRNNPAEVERFRDLAYRQGRRFSVLVRPHKLMRPKVARVGWITAAYLACFRAFGYRYILHPWLNPVRQVIFDSFTNDEPTFHESDTLQIRVCDEHDSDEPKIGVIITPDGSLPVYVQIDYWNYHIRLPMPFRRSDVLEAMVAIEVEKGFVIPTGEGEVVGIGVECYKNSIAPNLHICVWDHVLGKAD